MAHFSNWEEFKKAMDRLHEETVRLRQQIELDYQRWRAEMEAWKNSFKPGGRTGAIER
jgi:hypothetical protein